MRCASLVPWSCVSLVPLVTTLEAASFSSFIFSILAASSCSFFNFSAAYVATNAFILASSLILNSSSFFFLCTSASYSFLYFSS